MTGEAVIKAPGCKFTFSCPKAGNSTFFLRYQSDPIFSDFTVTSNLISQRLQLYNTAVILKNVSVLDHFLFIQVEGLSFTWPAKLQGHEWINLTLAFCIEVRLSSVGQQRSQLQCATSPLNLNGKTILGCFLIHA